MKYKKGVNRSGELYLLNTRNSMCEGILIDRGVIVGEWGSIQYNHSMFHGKDFTNPKRGIIIDWKARYHLWDPKGYFVVGMGSDL